MVRSTRTAVQEILVGATIQTAVLVSGDHCSNSKMFRSWTSWYGSTAPAGVKSEELILVERWGTQKISENPFGCEFYLKICFFRFLIVNLSFANLGRLLYSPLYFFLKISSLSWAAVHPEMYRYSQTAVKLSKTSLQDPFWSSDILLMFCDCWSDLIIISAFLIYL